MTERDFELPVRYVGSAEDVAGESPEDTNLLRSMAREAESYLCSFAWCQSVEKRYFGAGVGGVVGVFFFRIRPSRLGVDEWLWVIVGDLPPAYLVTDQAKTPSEALRVYIHEMRRWSDLAKSGRTSPDVISVSVPPTPEYAGQLVSRLRFLEEEILPRFREEEIERA
jgi:hypothetical protein